MASCGDCKFRAPIPDGDLVECRIRAPAAPVSAPGQAPIRSGWPVCRLSDVCGEYKARS